MAVMNAFDALLEDDTFADSENPTSTEVQVSADVAVKAHEENEEIQEIVEQATTIEEMTEQAEAVTEAAETAAELRANIQENGLTPQAYTIMRMFVNLDKVPGAILPAAEAMDTTGRNYDSAQMVIAALEAMEKSWWERIKEFFKRLAEKVKSFFLRVRNSATSLNKKIKDIESKLKDITEEPNLSDIKVSSSLWTAAEIKKALLNCNTVKAAIINFKIGLSVAEYNDIDPYATIVNDHTGATTLAGAGYVLNKVKGDLLNDAKSLANVLNVLSNTGEKDVSAVVKEALFKLDKKDDKDKQRIKELQELASKLNTMIMRGINTAITAIRAYLLAANKIIAASKKQ